MTRLLTAMWLLLLGGRWLVTPYLMLGDPALAERVIGWDQGVLLYCYQILLIMTLLVPVLGWVRHVQKSPESEREIREKQIHSA